MTDIWISALPNNFAFVTFDTAEGVDKVLADTPIVIFGQRYGSIKLLVLETFETITTVYTGCMWIERNRESHNRAQAAAKMSPLAPVILQPSTLVHLPNILLFLQNLQLILQQSYLAKVRPSLKLRRKERRIGRVLRGIQLMKL